MEENAASAAQKRVINFQLSCVRVIWRADGFCARAMAFHACATLTDAAAYKAHMP